MIKTTLINIIEMGSKGGFIFLLLILLVGISGIADATRDSEGKFRKKLNFKSILGFSLMIIFIFTVLYLGNNVLIDKLQALPSFHILFLNSFGIFFFIMLTDLIILDYLIIVLWHPKFLNLPNTDYYNKFKPHFQGFLRGQILGIFFSALASITNIYFYS